MFWERRGAGAPDASNGAYTVVDEVPEESIRNLDRRRCIMGLLTEAQEAAEEEWRRYKEELGLKDWRRTRY